MHVICVASTGLASSLLPMGQTAHSTFKMHLNLDESSVYNIAYQSQLATQLRQTTLLIWDEAPMQHKFVVLAVERTLQDVCNNEALFGGIPVVFGGDFKQTLPVIRHGGHAQQVEACIQQSRIWPQLQILFLNQNMQLHQTEENEVYAWYLKELSFNARLYGSIHLPPFVTQAARSEQLNQAIYPPEQLRALTPNNAAVFFKGCGILTVTNCQAVEFNSRILDTCPGASHVYNAKNRADPGEGDDTDLVTAEVMQTLNCSSLPLSHFTLKVGAPVMIL
ncbi:hypothetical protein DSO57_1039631 [Entomophthora muscae]|uniref:Uncharacterized protein n=1 Tax=Entomophthora muscae TaxID=34485 RepID=A0ACC2TPZ7_9FUNG|nr:hypothetical protein DSO57_1039631 [Entomophthora muscae]